MSKSDDANPWQTFEKTVIRLIAKAASVEPETVGDFTEIPPDSSLGDIATTISFHLTKEVKKNPAEIAAGIKTRLDELARDEPLIDRVEVKGPYINLFFDRGELAKRTLIAIKNRGEEFGRTEEFKGLRALIESPAVNPSKPWHIGHARNAVIGDTLGNILEAVGYDVLRTDYINNLGLQIAQLAWKLQKEGSTETDQKYDHFLGTLYVDVQKDFETNPVVEQGIRETSRQLEDPESTDAQVSEEMITRCLKAQNETSYRLGIYHDLQIWESAIAHSGLLDTAREMMLSCESVFIPNDGDKAGCVVAKLDDLEEFKDMKDPYKVLFRSDGTRTYTGADVAFQMWKFGIVSDPFKYAVFENQPNGEDVLRTTLVGDQKNFGRFDVVFNVIGSEQAHPQKLIYTILDLLGYEEQSKNSHHIAYEWVGLEETDFSGRKGTWIGYSCDLVLDKAAEIAREEVDKRNPKEGEEFKDEVAAKIGSGAVRYLLLKASPDRKITFRWMDALDFNGDAGPYLQYSLARAKRIIEKADSLDESTPDYSLLKDNLEYELLKALSRYPEEVLVVARGLKKEAWGTSFSSNRITTYCYNLASLFSKFYDALPVLKAEDSLKIARRGLVNAFIIAMTNCLKLLGIPVVDRM
ncbi:MAG: arginine--tRNA ligase [Candidatus Thorarchaeota archaeon]|nr:MAG: arginine--tRNA ligase [Candidatus Thorarchaeota archaeon]